MNANRTHRFKDVLLALTAAGSVSVPLQRLQLQKLVYLMDVFSAVWREVSKPSAFESEKRGPYDRQIQNAVDALAFRGLVRVECINIRQLREIQTTYSLTRAGSSLVDVLAKQSSIRDQLNLAKEIAREISRPHRGWARIKDIVYAEPTYVSARDSGNRAKLSIDTPLANQTMILAAIFQSSWKWTARQPLTPAVFVRTLFLVFDHIREGDNSQLVL